MIQKYLKKILGCSLKDRVWHGFQLSVVKPNPKPMTYQLDYAANLKLLLIKTKTNTRVKFCLITFDTQKGIEIKSS